ncbi:hypothetical protein TNCV_4138741 [Trichonephila clavipes]|nr:hypothetical protein TNCV_4138741 [Trichonephila clavipes]
MTSDTGIFVEIDKTVDVQMFFVREEENTTDLIGVSNGLSLHSVGVVQFVSDTSNKTWGFSLWAEWVFSTAIECRFDVR